MVIQRKFYKKSTIFRESCTYEDLVVLNNRDTYQSNLFKLPPSIGCNSTTGVFLSKCANLFSVAMDSSSLVSSSLTFIEESKLSEPKQRFYL